ncbi:MAG TPA: gliding motility lipoprotein GldD, partial [Pedobacter sp.]
MKNLFLCCIILILGCAACDNDSYTPKPRGYFNIKFPKKEYLSYNDGCPFTFDYPKYANIRPDRERDAGNCWNNLNFPQFNARLHLTYYDISSAKEY